MILHRWPERAGVRANSTTYFVSIGALTLLFATGCGDDGTGAQLDAGSTESTFSENTDTPTLAEAGQSECDDTDCGAHGSCDARGECACAEGYAGRDCGDCAGGYHEADGECEVDASCTPEACPEQATCTESEGVIECECVPGYAGDDCEQCAAGYHTEEGGCLADEVCLDTTCGSAGTCSIEGGIPTCECAAGYAGQHCEACAAGYHADEDLCLADASCSADSCSQHGTCDDQSGEVVCSCDAGFTGANCSECATGLAPNADGDCVVQCAPGQSLSAEGDCIAAACDAGVLVELADGGFDCVLDCQAGYTGDDCSACSPGHHDVDGECVADAECNADSCSGRGSCDDSSGVVVCDCSPGFLGEDCSVCDSGLHPDSDGCSAAPTCQVDSCYAHGSCDDGTGAIVCTCDAGYAGERCDACATDYVLDEGACVPLEIGDTCGADTCSGHGACDDSSGTPVCTCDDTHSGLACQACAAGFVADETLTCVASVCGDGIIDPNQGEDCDDGNLITELCDYHPARVACTTCTSACTTGPGVIRYCGDGVVQAAKGEACDDGNRNGRYGEGPNDAECKADCSGVGPYCGDGIVDGVYGETCDDGLGGDCPDTCIAEAGAPDAGVESCEATLTQSSDMSAITPINSISCNDNSAHDENSYGRIFSLPALEIDSFSVTQVRIGIEAASSAGATQPISVRIYRTTAASPSTATLELVASADTSVAPMSGQIITVPIAATVAGGAGASLFAEVYTPDGHGSSNLFFVGSNATGQSGPSYIKAGACGVTDWTNIADLNFPDMHILLHVDGFASGPICAEETDAGPR